MLLKFVNELKVVTTAFVCKISQYSKIKKKNEFQEKPEDAADRLLGD